MKEYKYEVAFSFLKEDEELALKLYDLLQDRMPTFLYSKEQEEIAGTDGEKTFNQVFKKDSRVVVVLYRAKWGKTPWTRIEETAIRNRGYDEGYDFVLFIPLENPPQIPEWLPKTQLWIGVERFGMDGAASIIENRVQVTGGSSRKETVEEYATRRKREINFEREKLSFLNSENGLRAAQEEAENLISKIGAAVGHIVDLPIEIVGKMATGNNRWIDIKSKDFSVSIDWVCSYSHNLSDSPLKIVLRKGIPPRPGRLLENKPEDYKEETYWFEINLAGTRGWRDATTSQWILSEDLAETWIRCLLAQITDY